MMPGSKVFDSLMMPWLWMPDSWEKAFAPTTGMVGGTGIPEKRSIRRAVSTRYFVFIPVDMP